MITVSRGRSLLCPGGALLFFLLWLLCLVALRLAGLFSPLPALAAAAAAAVFVAGIRPSAADGEPNDKSDRRPWRLCAVLLALFYVARPGEQLSGNWDPGVYLAQGVAASRSASWKLEDKAAPLVGPEDMAGIYPFQNRQRIKVPGFYAPGRPFGEIVPQFVPLYPTLLAAACWLGGMALALRVDGLLLWLSVLLVADASARVARRRGAGLFCLLLFGLHPAVIWFARFHTTESVTLFLFASLLWSGCRLAVSGGALNLLVLCAGIFLLPWSTAAALPVSLGALLLAFACGRALSGRERAGIVAASLLGAVSLLWFFRANEHPYARHMARIVPSAADILGLLTSRALLAAAVGLVLAGVLVLVWRRLAKRWTAPRGGTAVFFAAMAGAAALAPRLPAKLPPVLDGIVALAPVPWWLGLGAGFLLLCRHRPELRRWAVWVLAVTLLVTAIFWRWPLIPMSYPWTWKRWIWILLPSTAFFTSAGLALAAPRSAARATIMGMALLALLLAPCWRYRALVRGGEWRGLHRWLAYVSASVPRDALVMAPKELATPLEFIFGHATIPLYGDPTARLRGFYENIWTRQTKEHPVVVLDSRRPDWLPAAAARAVALAPYRGDWIQPQRRPAALRRQSRGFDVSLWSPAAGQPATEPASPARPAVIR